MDRDVRSISMRINNGLLAQFLSIQLIRVVVSRIVFRADVFKSKRSNRRQLRDVPTGFGPVEMERVAGQNDDGTGWIGLQLVGVELITQAEVENAGDNCINSILRVPGWQETAVKAVEAVTTRFGTIDGLVNNAGIFRTKQFTDLRPTTSMLWCRPTCWDASTSLSSR